MFPRGLLTKSKTKSCIKRSFVRQTERAEFRTACGNRVEDESFGVFRAWQLTGHVRELIASHLLRTWIRCDPTIRLRYRKLLIGRVQLIDNLGYQLGFGAIGFQTRYAHFIVNHI